MQDQGSGPPRILAPVAVALFGIVFLLVVFTSGGSDDTDSESSRRGETRSERREDGDRRRGRSDEKIDSATYTVRTGDTLAEIARRTGKSVEELQQLNPELDAQALVSGQKIKLRE